jgi:hypothetical protein
MAVGDRALLKLTSNIVIFVLLLAVIVSAQNEPLQLRHFKGLNTVAGDFAVQPNECRRAHNIDWSQLGAIKKRAGYDSVATISGQDSIVGIYSMYDRDGTKRLVIVTDSAGVGYGNVYVTNNGSVNLTSDSLTRIATKFGVTAKPSFATYNDALYMVNGQHKGISWNGDLTVNFPMNAPAEPRITPLIDSYGVLNGEYRYLMYVTNSFSVYPNPFNGGAVSNFQGYVSQPVVVNNGSVLLSNFIFPSADSTHPYDNDSCLVSVYRTTANPGRLTSNTKFYRLSTSYLLRDSVATFTISDNISDSLLEGGLYYGRPIESEWRGRGDTGLIYTNYGAPGYISENIDSAYTLARDSANNYGVYFGMPESPASFDTIGVVYAVTYIDTASGFESDTSRGCYIRKETDTFPAYSYTISIPQPIDTGLKINLYRGLLYNPSYSRGKYWDTTVASWSDKVIEVTEQDLWVIIDSNVVSDLYLVAQLDYGDTLWTDSVRTDSSTYLRRYSRKQAPSLIDNIFTYNNRMVGTQGSRLYFSRLDSAFAWGAFDFVSLGEGDGDEGVVAFPTRTGIRFAKNNSFYNIQPDWSTREIAQNFGIIAPKSYTPGVGGQYYLSGHGVVRENEGAYLERTQQFGLVSEMLDNFDKLSNLTKQPAVGFFHDRKYMLSIPSVDTTYVYDEKANAWSTWGFTFSDAVHYGASNEVGFIAGDTMYFVKPGDSTLYRFGSSNKDNGSGILLDWLSVPLMLDKYNYQVTGTALWYDNESAGDSIIMFYMPEGRRYGGVSELYYYTNMTSYPRYMHKSRTARPEALYYQFNLLTNSTSTSRLLIDGIDIYGKRLGRRTIQ